MKVGDLVKFCPNQASLKAGGSLTAVKYFTRINNQIGDKTGIIIENHGNNFSVMFGKDILIVNKAYLGLIDKNAV